MIHTLFVIYLDYAATTPLDPRVYEAIVPHIRDNWGNPSSPHAIGRQARSAVDESRLLISKLSGYRPAEIIFTGSGSEASTLAIRGVCAHWRTRHGEPGRILSTKAEHRATLQTLDQLKAEGWQVTELPLSPDGLIDLKILDAELSLEAALLTIHWVNNETGVIQPVDDIIAACKRTGVPCHLDALQAAGRLPFPAPLPDLLSTAAHKFYGPKGIGALFAREAVELQPVVPGGGQEHGLRGGTENVPGIVGYGEALRIALEERNVTHKKLTAFSERFITEVTKIPGVTLNGSRTQRLPHIVNVQTGMDAATLVMQLDLRGICVSTGAACATGAAEASHVLQAMGKNDVEVRQSLRISFGKPTTEADIDTLLAALHELL